MVSITARVHAIGQTAAEPAAQDAQHTSGHVRPGRALVLHAADHGLPARGTTDHRWIGADLGCDDDRANGLLGNRCWLWRYVVDVVVLLGLRHRRVQALSTFWMLVVMVLVVGRLGRILALVVCRGHWHGHGHSWLRMRVALLIFHIHIEGWALRLLYHHFTIVDLLVILTHELNVRQWDCLA